MEPFEIEPRESRYGVANLHPGRGSGSASGARAVEIEESRADLDQRGTEHSQTGNKELILLFSSSYGLSRGCCPTALSNRKRTRAPKNALLVLSGSAECLTTPGECDNNGAGFGARIYSGRTASCPKTSGRIPPGEDGMDLEKDKFQDDNELSGLEEDDELAGGEVVETEEEELMIGEEEPETAPAPAARPAAPSPAPKKPAKKAPKKKAKKAKPKKKAAKKKDGKRKKDGKKKAARKKAKRRCTGSG